MPQKRSKEHIKAQKEGKARDNGTCQICGSKENVEGHHIVNYQYGGSPNNENIVALCKEHHKEVHKGNIDIIKF